MQALIHDMVYTLVFHTLLGLMAAAFVVVVALVISRLLSSSAPSPRALSSSYKRSLFGSPWKDMDNNGRDTRNDMLARDLSDVLYDQNNNVSYGVLHDPYMNSVVDYHQGSGASVVSVDHLVPLSFAFERGAKMWSAADREHFANDPMNLVTTTTEANLSKSNKGIASWLPPHVAFQGEYVRRFAFVAAKYHLFLTDAERAVVAAHDGVLNPVS